MCCHIDWALDLQGSQALSTNLERDSTCDSSGCGEGDMQELFVGRENVSWLL